MQQAGGALDVREEEGDGAGGEVATHVVIMRPEQTGLKQTLLVRLI
jgi:hypothetical protein